MIIELDSDVIWSWYTVSSSLKAREFSVRELSKSTAKVTWALVIHAVSAAMLWAVFINSTTGGLAGGRLIDEPQKFDVYLEGCAGMDAEAVSRFLNGSTQPFWNMNDRLWLRNGTAAAIFATYNGDQPNDLQLVHDLCSEAGCMPSAIVAVNGETNATKMQEITYSFINAFCPLTRRSLATETHYGSGGSQTWTQLSKDQKRYWLYLGWDEASFNIYDSLKCRNDGTNPCLPQPLTLADSKPNPEFVEWDDLTDNQIFSATQLGWTRSLWDAGEDPRRFLKVTVQNTLERDALFAFVQVCAFTVMSLAVVSEYRNFVMAAMFTFGIEKRLVTRVVLLLVALIGYLLVPIFVQCASALVIFEAGTELDVLMDSLALLFILETNNYFQFAHNPSSTAWHISLPPETYIYIDKVRDWFGRVASVLIIAWTIPLGSVFTLWPHTLVHPVWLFNPVYASGAATGFMVGLCAVFVILVAVLLKYCGRYAAIVEAANNEEANENLMVPGDGTAELS